MSGPTCLCDRCGGKVPHAEIESVPDAEMFVCRDCAAERNGLVKRATDAAYRKAVQLWASRSEANA